MRERTEWSWEKLWGEDRPWGKRPWWITGLAYHPHWIHEESDLSLFLDPFPVSFEAGRRVKQQLDYEAWLIHDTGPR